MVRGSTHRPVAAFLLPVQLHFSVLTRHATHLEVKLKYDLGMFLTSGNHSPILRLLAAGLMAVDTLLCNHIVHT